MAVRALNGLIRLFNASDQFKLGLTIQACVFINGHKADKPYLPNFDRMDLILEFYRKEW
jgi:hypothetical protein